MRYAWMLGLALAVVPALAAQEVGLAPGTQAPTAVVRDLDGRAVDLRSYVGHRPVVLEFWATWCPLCAALEPSLKAAYARYGHAVQFLAIGVGVNQSPASIRRHLADHPLPFPVLFDSAGTAVRAYQAPTTSYIVVVDKAGTVTYTGTGEDQDIAAVLKRLAVD